MRGKIIKSTTEKRKGYNQPMKHAKIHTYNMLLNTLY